MIICRGIRLMAGPPTSSPRPGSVTFPTPSPCKKRMPGSLPNATVTQILQPFVTSGSSPESFTTVAVAASFSINVSDTGNVISSSSGSVNVTFFCGDPVSNARSAAFAAAVAHDPVVYPLRNEKNPGTKRSICLRNPKYPVTTIKVDGNTGRLTA